MKKYVLLMVVFAFLASGCKDNMAKLEAGDASSTKKVMIASDKTDFKKEVVTKVSEALIKDGYFVKVTGLDELNSADTAQFGAVVILNPCWAGAMDGKVSDYMKNHVDDKKVIIFTTAGNGTWKPDLKVDVITGASVMETADSKANEIVSLVKKRF
jgi:hypothetical protein